MEGEGITKEEGMEEEEVPIIQHTIRTKAITDNWGAALVVII